MFTAITTFIGTVLYYIVYFAISVFIFAMFWGVTAEIFREMNKDLRITAYFRLIKNKVKNKVKHIWA